MERKIFTSAESGTIQFGVGDDLPRTGDIQQHAHRQTNHKAKKPETKVIASVSHTPRTSSHIIASDITQYLYFYMMFLQPGDGRLSVFLCTVHFGEHDAELHPAGIIHLRADNVVIHVEATRGFRSSGASTE